VSALVRWGAQRLAGSSGAAGAQQLARSLD